MQGDAGEIRIALAGDWATGTDEAHTISELIKAFKPHYTIHLGDVYYVGDPNEVDENFLGKRNPDNEYSPCLWPKGSKGAFALVGNHEMYALGGSAYFDRMLPTLGLIEGGVSQAQKASFFCLENEFWRIIALDTGIILLVCLCWSTSFGQIAPCRPSWRIVQARQRPAGHRSAESSPVFPNEP